MTDLDQIYHEEYETIKNERKMYSDNNKLGVRLLEYLSFLFWLAGFAALGLSFFTDITLLNATCLFVISHVVAPSSLELENKLVRGITEDLAHIRLNTRVLSKKDNTD